MNDFRSITHDCQTTGTVAFGITFSEYVGPKNGTTVNVPLVMTLAESFMEELNNRSSEQHKHLEAQVVSMVRTR